MSEFEFLLIFLAILMSFVVARVVTALPDIFDKPRRYWVHCVWSVAAIGNVVISWWAIYQYRDVTWTLHLFLLFVAPAACWLFVAAALAPDEPSDVTDWRNHYFRVHRQLIGATIVSQLMISVFNSLVMEGWSTIALAIPSVAGLLLAPALFTKRPQVHGAVAIFYLFIVVAYTTGNPPH